MRLSPLALLVSALLGSCREMPTSSTPDPPRVSLSGAGEYVGPVGGGMVACRPSLEVSITGGTAGDRVAIQYFIVQYVWRNGQTASLTYLDVETYFSRAKVTTGAPASLTGWYWMAAEEFGAFDLRIEVGYEMTLQPRFMVPEYSYTDRSTAAITCN